MNQDVATLRAAINVVTRILAERNIPVVQRGLEARVGYNHLGEPVEIQVPYIPDDASPALIRAIHGFIDHEVGHVLDTDAKTTLRYHERWRRQYGQRASVVQMFQNILEDVYIERQQEQRFRGCGYNLGQVRQFLLDTIVTPRLSELTDPKDVCEMLTFVVFRAWGGQSVFENYLSDKWGAVSPLVDKIPENLRQQVRKINSTEDACQVAEALFEAIMQHQQPPEPESGDDDSGGDQGSESDQSDQDETSSTDSSGESDQGSSSDESEGDSSQESESSQSDESESETESEAESDTSDSDAESDEGGEGESGSESSETNDSSGESTDGQASESEADEDSDDESGDAEQGKAGQSSGDDAAMSFEDFDPEDFDSLASQAIRQSAVEAAENTDYLPYSEEWDDNSIWEPSGDRNRILVPAMLDRVEHLIGPMAHSLERIIKTRSLARWASGHRRGRLDARTTSRLALSKRHPELHTDRICKQREVSVTNDVCVSIVVDCSGSMAGDRIQTAMDSAYGIASTLERLGIATEVTGFTTADMPYDKRQQMWESEVQSGVCYARTNTLYMPTFKAFHERVNSRVTARFACFPRESGGRMQATILGEPVRLAYERLIQRPEKGRLMIVLTDGEPAAHTRHERGMLLFTDHAKRVIEEIEQSRHANILGIGIDIDVNHLFSRCFRVNTVAELPSVLIRELKGYVIDHTHN